VPILSERMGWGDPDSGYAAAPNAIRKHRRFCGLEFIVGLCFQWFTLFSNCW
jgi:hypothetical protein